MPPEQQGRATDREILRLAVPAFGALVAEPLFLLADSAIVGRLGTVPLAGLGVAGALLATAIGIFVFLAYGTTAAVARRAGAGDLRGAVADGIGAAVAHVWGRATARRHPRSGALRSTLRRQRTTTAGTPRCQCCGVGSST